MDRAVGSGHAHCALRRPRAPCPKLYSNPPLVVNDHERLNTLGVRQRPRAGDDGDQPTCNSIHLDSASSGGGPALFNKASCHIADM